MKCQKCGREIVTRGNSVICKECRFKENYKAVNFNEHKYFLKQAKTVLRENGISYERFSEILGYDCGTVKDFLVMKKYSEPLKEAIETAIEKLKSKKP